MTDTPVTRPRVYRLSGDRPTLGVIRVAHVSKPFWKAIPDPERDDLHGAVPDGHVIYIAPGYRAKPGTCDVSLRRLDREANVWRVVRQVRGRLTARLVWSVLRGEVVTTDAQGNVTSIEDVA